MPVREEGGFAFSRSTGDLSRPATRHYIAPEFSVEANFSVLHIAIVRKDMFLRLRTKQSPCNVIKLE